MHQRCRGRMSSVRGLRVLRPSVAPGCHWELDAGRFDIEIEPCALARSGWERWCFSPSAR
jgi:hypothetical protein